MLNELTKIAGVVSVWQEQATYVLQFANGSTRNATDAEILAAVKAHGIAANRAECSRRIFERYPAGRQLSALAGLYDSANVATMVDWIAANIAAENTAADAIEAVQPGPNAVAEVEAVSVSWPV